MFHCCSSFSTFFEDASPWSCRVTELDQEQEFAYIPKQTSQDGIHILIQKLFYDLYLLVYTDAAPLEFF